jgi:hypothetical protein
VKPKQWILLLLLGLVACASNLVGPSLSFRQIASGGGPFRSQTLQVVRDAATWNALFPRLSPAPVNFTSEMVIVVSPGEKSVCHGVTVDHIEKENQRLIVAAIEEKPAPGCACILLAWSPYVAVAVAKSDANVEAEWSDRTRQDCG